MAGKITYEDVKGGREGLDAQRSVLELAINAGIVEIGVVDKKMNRKDAAEKANQIADYVENRLLSKGGHNPLYDKSHDKIAGDETSMYAKSQYLIEHYGFDRSTFIQSAIQNGLSREQVERVISSLMEHKERSHQGSATADVDFGNLEEKLSEVEEDAGIVVGKAHRSFEKARSLIYAQRAGQLSTYVENTPGIHYKKDKKKPLDKAV